MRLSPLRSGAFRFAVMVAAVFAIGTALLLVMVETSVSHYATEVATESVATELTVLREEARVPGSAQIVKSVARREKAVREHQLRYLLVDREGRYLAGSLPVAAAQIGWNMLTLPNRDAENDDGAATMTLMALGARLDDGAILVVASDTSDLNELRQRLGTSTAIFGIAITLLALLGGYVVGTMFMRRLDRANRSVERIMQGSLTERLPPIGMSAEFDQLSTNLNMMLDRIEALMEGMRQVSTDIAHDLRTPLTRLRQRLEEMRDGTPGMVSEAQIEAALAQTDQILAVFRALLRISSVEAGAGRQRIGETDLTALMERLFEAYRPVAEDTEHVLGADIAQGVTGRADPEMLTQAVTNLIENAIFHTPPGSIIMLALEQRQGGISISVADNGPGIPETERDRVLQRFYRLDRSRGAPGAGLGLALVSAVAMIHNAVLRLSDNRPGLRVDLILGEADVH